jgi:hypothetical protein
MSLIVLKDATYGRGISVVVPQLDPFGRPLTPETASLLGTEQAGRLPFKLIAGLVAVVLAALVAAVALLVVGARPAHAPARTAKPETPKLLAPSAFAHAFSAAMADADKHAHGPLETVTIGRHELDVLFQPRNAKRLIVTTTAEGETTATAFAAKGKVYTQGFERSQVDFQAPAKVVAAAAQVVGKPVSAMVNVTLLVSGGDLAWVVVIGGKYLHGDAEGNLIT